MPLVLGTFQKSLIWQYFCRNSPECRQLSGHRVSAKLWNKTDVSPNSLSKKQVIWVWFPALTVMLKYDMERSRMSSKGWSCSYAQTEASWHATAQRMPLGSLTKKKKKKKKVKYIQFVYWKWFLAHADFWAAAEVAWQRLLAQGNAWQPLPYCLMAKATTL